MMRLPAVEVHFPEKVADAVALHAATPAALYIAGGTDLLPNLKHRLYETTDLVSLSRLALGGVTREPDGTIRIGAGAVIADLVEDPVLRVHLPSLADALGLVAGPLHRNRATIGGNVMLDTRCLFYNQTDGWRKALGHCLKKDGDWCHVIDSGKRCVAARSNDSAPLLLALDADLMFAVPGGEQRVPIRQLYAVDGRVEMHLKVPRSALLVEIVVPPPIVGRRVGIYRKVRRRGAIDFPQLGLAVVLEATPGPDGRERINSLSAVLGALMPEPRILKRTDVALGSRLEESVVAALAQEAATQAHAQESIHGSPAWRKEMAAVEMRRALELLRGWLN